MLGKDVFDPAMQAYLGDRVAYERRGRVIAITELSWSLGFILGVPLMGLLIARRGWAAPFPVLALLALAAIAMLAWLVPRDAPHPSNQNGLWSNLRSVLTSRLALTGLAMCLLLSAANEMVSLVFGAWMEISFSLKIAALGAASAVIGFAELGGEALTATLTDRIGKARAVAAGVILNILAGLALPFLGSSQAGAFVGLFLFFLTFEFAIVSSISLMTEVFPPARATLMASNLAAHSLGRALGALLTAPLFALGQASLSTPDILPSALASAAFNLLGLLALFHLHRRMTPPAS
jgi:predicted MFS family arabinose efflux permease